MINPKEARLAAGLTQTEAAQMIGATMRAWQEWEGNRRNMPVAKYTLFLMLTQPAANGAPVVSDPHCTV